jgi:hypothetical protein
VGHLAKYIFKYIAECLSVGTRQRRLCRVSDPGHLAKYIFKLKKIFAECQIAGTRQRRYIYRPRDPLLLLSLSHRQPPPPPSPSSPSATNAIRGRPHVPGPPSTHHRRRSAPTRPARRCPSTVVRPPPRARPAAARPSTCNRRPATPVSTIVADTSLE